MEQKIFTQKELDKIEDAVIKAQHGDVAGFEYLYEFARNNCRYAAYSHINNKNDADDAFQAAFLKVYENIGSIKNPRTFISYINTAINHTCYDMNKKHDNSRVDTFTDKEYEDGPEFLDTFVDESDYAKVDVNIEHEERQKLIDEIMSDLSDEQKACVFAYYIQEISIKDIAAEYNVSENTIKSRLFQSRKKMEAKGNELKKRGIEFFGLTIVAFLVSLSSMEAKACEYTAPAFNTTMAHTVATKTIATNTAASTGAKTAAKAGIKIMGKTISTKIAAIGTAAIVGAGVIGAGVILTNQKDDDTFYICTDFDQDGNYTTLITAENIGYENEYIFTYVNANDSETNPLNQFVNIYNKKDIHIYAKMFNDTIYITTNPSHYYSNDSDFVIWTNDDVASHVPYFRYESNIDTYSSSDNEANIIAHQLYESNFDFSSWIDLTTLGTKGMDRSEAYKYSIAHQDEWIKMISASSETIPTMENESVTNNSSNPYNTNELGSDNNSSKITSSDNSTPFSGKWTNDYPGAFEGISYFEIDFDNNTYYAGDAYGVITYIGNNQYSLHLKGFSDGTLVDEDDGIITIIDNNDGTISINNDVLKKVGTFSW